MSERRERRPAVGLTAEQSDRDEALPESVRHRGFGSAHRQLGCPRGCPLDHHECGVGEPVAPALDWLDASCIGYVDEHGVHVVTLRRHYATEAAA